ncbi:protein serine/threonine kinase, putative [Entamoeba invadens IP1]|uniref:Protein serine/threonine kinase, putative n=1 Tax=Entamoeba invadens IP1 TaxID=370355 RepID=L7FKG3_ENTIV|nr:protein serine/threonine kinase, putative [Entamoeba invadens IP1]ELP86358.1 protein serine/threonine kinase, putative [Entamoeba invadens IP1]|eukprot:XP_004185704.1 protein serine/threonine kinase, putative [Entamoeba invadens IP1]
MPSLCYPLLLSFIVYLACSVGCGYDECSYCNWANTCTQCYSGSHRDADFSYCYKCRRECKECNGERVCTLCVDGYYLLQEGSDLQTCRPCSIGCKTCTSVNQCSSCDSSFFLDTKTQKCNKCIAGCASCSQSDKCEICERGYTNINGLCYDCSSYSCMTNCQKGTFLSTTGCLSCPSQCISCTMYSQCTACKDGYYLSNSGECKTCNSAMSGCLKCSSQTTCLNCGQHYRLLTDGSCSKCPDNYMTPGVDTCSNKNYPRNCMSGYTDPYDYCEKCPDNCHMCTTLKHTCVTCQMGYYLSGSNCKKCVSGCDYCTNESSCVRCKVGYVNWGSYCVPCTQYEGCKYCQNECKQCENGYYLSGSTCVKCANCLMCDSGKCHVCASMYTPSIGSSCDLCENVISGCVSCSSTSPTCLKCIEGQTLYDNKCYECTIINPHCTTCSITSPSCLKCDENYNLVDAKCVSTSIAIPNCIVGTRDENKCVKCNTSYVLSTDHFSCNLCSSEFGHCLSCSQINYECTKCDIEYGITLSSTCSLCSEDATGCISPQNGICPNGLSPFDNFCFDCKTKISNCSSCSTISWQCADCDATSNFTNLNGVCTLCDIPNCFKCSSSSYECLECGTGFYVESGNCTKLCGTDELCIKCENDKCSHCKIGYHINEYYECVECTDTLCTLPENNMCKPGQFLSKGYCWETSLYKKNCEYANPSYDNCLYCKTGFGFNATNNCLPCESGCESCLYDYQKCIKCKSGYVTKSQKCYPFTRELCDTFNDKIGCEGCKDTFNIVNGNCVTNTEPNCLVSNGDSCEICDNNYYYDNSSNSCVLYTENVCLYLTKSKCMLCSDGYYLKYNDNANECLPCPANCTTCIYDQYSSKVLCLSCSALSHYIVDGSCEIKPSHCIATSLKKCDICEQGYYISNTSCEQCASPCVLCLNSSLCTKCEGDYVLRNGVCSKIQNCTSIQNGECLLCDDGNYLTTDGGCSLCVSNCKSCKTETACSQCKPGYLLTADFLCKLPQSINSNVTSVLSTGVVSTKSEIYTRIAVTNCMEQTESGCIRCNKGYFIDKNMCKQCSQNCTYCNNYNECVTCENSMKPNTTTFACEVVTAIPNCKLMFNLKATCAVCDSGYIKDNQENCVKCDEECSQCDKTPNNCISCSSNYYMKGGKCELTSTIKHCLLGGKVGCDLCEIGYYNTIDSCSVCDVKCISCNSSTSCMSCKDNYILTNGICDELNIINFCSSSHDGICNNCKEGYHITSAHLCDKDTKLGLILGASISAFIVLLLLVVILTMIVFFLLRKKKEDMKTLFKMKDSNITFEPIPNKKICTNKLILHFNEDSEFIDVCEETRELLCIGNNCSHTLKLQLTSISLERCETSITPDIVVMKPGEACEFEIKIKPLCTCRIDSSIKIVYVDLKTSQENSCDIKIDVQTKLTSKLDYSELELEKKLGEGSFGVVYKGKFRGDDVAIKKLKTSEDLANEALDEFEREVSMLDKFRSEYIVHFYGAVFIPNKICMVTEFAKYGSARDLILDTTMTKPDYPIQLRLCLDAAKGVLYLHTNGIIHRDIKPDNILVFSLDRTENVIAKLTDFGSSRNVNLLMTNMTFTKGIGTPIYMAPEILQQEKYKKSADIFSLAVTMLELTKWGEVYEKSQFKFPWIIAEYVSNGLRLNRPENVKESIYEVIQKCWKHNPIERLEVSSVVSKLQELYEQEE